MSKIMLVAGWAMAVGAALGYRIRWLGAHHRAERLQAALDDQHEQWGKSENAWRDRETKWRLDRERWAAYAQQVKPS